MYLPSLLFGLIVTNFKNGKRRKAEWFYIAGAFLVIAEDRRFWYLRSEEAFGADDEHGISGKQGIYRRGWSRFPVLLYNESLQRHTATANPCEGAMMYGFSH